MQTCAPESCIQTRVLDPNVGEPAPRMDEYILMATQKLEAIAEQVGRGDTVDRDSHAWMLAQVDFLTDSFGNETLELADEIRSSVLQLVLAIANLNEQIRHQSSLSL